MFEFMFVKPYEAIPLLDSDIAVQAQENLYV